MNNKLLQHGTWVVVADGEKALFLRNYGSATKPDLQVFREEEHDNPANRDQNSDRAGRRSGPGGQTSAVEQTDWHMLEKLRFARELAAILYRHVHNGLFERLVLVAQPEVLGALRHEMHSEVRQTVVLEIPKTLTKHPVSEIESLLMAYKP